MIFDENLKNITNICQNNALCLKRVNDLYNFIASTYPLMDDLLLERMNEENIEKLGINLSMKEALDNIFESIVNNKDNSLFFNNIDSTLEKPINQIIVIIYNYISKKLNINDVKFSIYLELFGIDFENFLGLSMEAVLSICELYNRGIDISKFENYGSYLIEFVNNVANGRFDDKNYIKVRAVLASTIDECFETGETIELDFSNGSLIFERMDVDIISVFDVNSLDTPIAILNSDNEFLVGNYDLLLKYYNKIDEANLDADGLDEIIELFN